MFLKSIVLRVEEKIFLQSECSFGRFLSWVGEYRHLDMPRGRSFLRLLAGCFEAVCLKILFPRSSITIHRISTLKPWRAERRMREMKKKMKEDSVESGTYEAPYKRNTLTPVTYQEIADEALNSLMDILLEM